MNDRDKILTAVDQALAPLPRRTPYPEWSAELSVARHAREVPDLLALFTQRLSATNGVAIEGIDAIPDFLRAHNASLGVVDPALLPLLESTLSSFRLETIFDPERHAEFHFGITRGAGAIAESGTIVLNDASTYSRLAALAPWIHIAIVEKASVLRTIPEAVAAFGDDPSIIFVTGPSKTADIEGILIEGVHGPGIQACCVV